MTSAIRPGELYEVLKAIKDDAPSVVEGCAAAATTVQTSQQAASEIIAQLDAKAPAGTKAAIAAVTNKIETIVGNDISQAKELIQRYATATDAAFINLEKWFNSAQDRAQQWFTLHMRWITIGAAIVAAFVLQLDTIELLKRILREHSSLLLHEMVKAREADSPLLGKRPASRLKRKRVAGVA